MTAAAFAVLFVVLATMNSAGYRYGASDQAFYIPAVVRHLDPALYPRDAALIDSQARLTTVDEAIAALAELTGLSLQHLFIALYVATLALLLAAAVKVASRLYRTGWAIVALGAALTLRHAVAKSGANTLEGYFHPRQLAFALGLFAVGFFLERRERVSLLLLAAAAAVHPTTALWFGVWLTVAVWLARPDWRRPLAIAAALLAVLATAAIAMGFGGSRLHQMDAAWLAVIADRDYLFPLDWPLDAWLTNLVTIPVIVICWRARARAGLTVSRETPLVVGALALAAVFVCWLPFNAAHVAIAVQLQTSRVFWLLDVFATIYLVWALAEGAGGGATGAVGASGARTARVAAVLILLSLARGLYVCYVQFPDRRLFAIDVQHEDWRAAMAWARTTDPRSGWLADPGHAALYGSSVRAIGWRDVLLERLKDRAIAMYDRDTAMRLAERERALAALAWDTEDGARALARRFGLDYLVIDRELNLPLVHQAGSLYIYRIR